MRTTVDVEEGLLERAKRHALGSQQTLSGVVNDALRAYLNSRRAPAKEPPFELVVAGAADDPFPSADEIRAVLDAEDVESLRLRETR